MSCDDDYSVAREPFPGLVRGDTYDFPFLSEETTDTVITDDTVWTPRNLSAGTFACMVRVGSEEGDEWTEATVVIDDSDAADGSYVLRLSTTGTAVPGFQYLFDIQYTEGSSIETLIAGYFEFEADVTHD